MMSFSIFINYRNFLLSKRVPPMKNLEIITILNNIADILELQGVQWKPQAYRKAARSVEALSEDIAEIWKRGELRTISGVGEAIGEKIEEILKTGKLKYYEKLKKEAKVDIEQLNTIHGLGPKKIKVLYDKLKIKNVADLEKAILQKKIQKLEGFGEETEKKLLHGIELFKTHPKRFLYAQAAPIVAEILAILKKYPFVKKAEVAGSFRRGKETVGDLDFLVISSEPEKVMQIFTSLPDVKEILSKGITRSSIRLKNGLQMDLRVVKEKEFGSAMNYFIGSKEHNVELRKLALSKGYTLSEYGLFKLKKLQTKGKETTEKKEEQEEQEKQRKTWVAGRTEEEIYQKLKLQYIPPELRENMGEIAAAEQNKLPKLIATKDIHGVFHNHSTWSDGNHSLLEMAQTAEKLGFQFISFNDHCGQIGITNPITAKRLVGYLKEIEQVRKKVSIKVFSGLEVDILKDGSLPLPLSLLRKLDVVIASIHLAQGMQEAEMTARVCRALEEYPVHILGHPTGRLLNERESIQLNFKKVFDVAKKRRVFLEINASPGRMDLDGPHIKAAKDTGCQFALSTDGHDVHHLSGFIYGILSARRGWLEKKDVLNCWGLEGIEKALKRNRKIFN